MIYGQELQEYIKANPKLVKAKESQRYPGLFVIKYTRKVFFDALWNDILEECRGLVVDANYDPVVKPFTKIYNRFERGTNIHRDEPVLAVRKVNGFMAAVTKTRDHGVITSTTGSLDSEFVDMAQSVLRDTLVAPFAQEGITYLFEICHDNDPHIIPEETGAYLIGARNIYAKRTYHSGVDSEIFLDTIATQMQVKRPEWRIYDKFSDLTSQMDSCTHEGYVVYSKDTALKIKSSYYLLKKLLARMNGDKLIRMLNNPNQLLSQFDEEYYPLIGHLHECHKEFASLDEQARLQYIRNYLENRNNE